MILQFWSICSPLSKDSQWTHFTRQLIKLPRKPSGRSKLLLARNYHLKNSSSKNCFSYCGRNALRQTNSKFTSRLKYFKLEHAEFVAWAMQKYWTLFMQHFNFKWHRRNWRMNLKLLSKLTYYFALAAFNFVSPIFVSRWRYRANKLMLKIKYAQIWCHNNACKKKKLYKRTSKLSYRYCYDLFKNFIFIFLLLSHLRLLRTYLNVSSCNEFNLFAHKFFR